MKDAAAISAQLVDMRNVGQHKSIKLTLHIPVEMADQARDAFGWPTMQNPVPVALARLVQPAAKEVMPDSEKASNAERPSDKTQPASVMTSPPWRASDKKLSQLAGMLSKTPLFHRYLETCWVTPCTENDAAEFIREKCEVQSRSEIIRGEPSGYLFLRLYDDFKKWEAADQYVEAL